jgi:hypothetical protein
MERTLPPCIYFAVAAVCACAAVGLVWAWVAFMPLAFLDPEYGAWVAKERMLARCDVGDMLVLGNSRAAAGVLPALMSVRTTNLAFGGGQPMEAFVAASRALSCAKPPRRVILAFNPGQFVRPDLFWERTVGFGLFGRNEIADLAAASRRTGDWSVYENGHDDGLNGTIRAALYPIRFPSLYFASFIKGGVFLRYWEDRRVLNAALAARGQYFFGTAPGCGEIALEGHLGHFTPLPVLDLYFARLLDLLARSKVQVLFVAMPLNESTVSASNAVMQKEFAAYLRAYQRRYPVLRLIGPPVNGWPDRFFGDGFSHLNPRGAALFSHRLAACLAGEQAACALDWREGAAQTARPQRQEGV